TLVSSSSVAKDLGATNISVASEILRYAQNDSCWRPPYCVRYPKPCIAGFHPSPTDFITE
ncbi:MAG: hypothetical protein IKC72_05350, partial [Clostridia bacterium]|nr:hypothetical protein [Clostridia bacterium]